MQCDGPREDRGYGIADLAGDFDLRSLEDEIIRECLQAGCFPVGDRPVLLWVEVTALLGLVELGADRVGRPVPPESAHHVRGARGLVQPAGRREVGAGSLEVEAIPTLGDGPVALEGGPARVSPDVQILFAVPHDRDVGRGSRP